MLGEHPPEHALRRGQDPRTARPPCLAPVRERYVADRTAKVNQLRGLLAEYGIVIGKGIGQARQRLPEILDDADNGLSGAARALFRELYDEIVRLDGQITGCDRKVGLAAKASAPCQRLMQVAGIGLLIATALVAAVGDGTGTAKAIDYTLNRWPALARYADSGHLPIDNNPVENAIRPIAIGKKNWLFAGSGRANGRR